VPRSRTAIRAAAFDIVAVIAFVATGRRSHDEGGNPLVGTLEVAAPFLIALAVGWAITRAWKQPESLRTGAGIWVVTVALGMLLRHTVFDRGTAASFIVVATIATAILLLGWRLVLRWVEHRRPPARTA
jgi:FlaA1/EpsC-like NDP-sugar epimerase